MARLTDSPTPLGNQVTLRSYGPAAAILEVGCGAHAADLYSTLNRWRACGDLAGLVDVVPGARTVLVRWSPDQAAPNLTQVLSAWQPITRHARAFPTIEIPVRYNGPDLDDVSRLTGLSRAQIITLHTSTTLAVAFSGFIPGFAYITGLPSSLQVRRRAEPRTAIPAGSVGLASEFTGIYPQSSPGVWQLIGHTDVTLFDPTANPPALLQPGQRVRFVHIGE